MTGIRGVILFLALVSLGLGADSLFPRSVAQSAALQEKHSLAQTATSSPESTVTATPRSGERERDREKERDKEKEKEREKKRTLKGEVTGKEASSFTLKERNGVVSTILVDNTTEFKQEGRGRSKASFADLQKGMQIAVYALVSAGTSSGPSATQTPTGTRTSASMTQDARILQTPTTTTTVTVTQTTTATVTTTPTATRTPIPRPQLTYLAKKVELPRVKEKFAHHIGFITAISDTSITIRDREDKTHTGVLKPQTKKLPTGATFAVGDRVLALARWDADEGADGAWVIILLVKLGQPPSPTPEPASSTLTATTTPSPTTTTTATATPTATKTPTGTPGTT